MNIIRVVKKQPQPPKKKPKPKKPAVPLTRLERALERTRALNEALWEREVRQAVEDAQGVWDNLVLKREAWLAGRRDYPV